MASILALLKGAFKSRTVWVNVLALAVQLLGHISGVVPPELAPYLTTALAVLNLILRALTTTPLVPGPTPDVPATDFPILVWLRDALIALANKEIKAPVELKAMIVAGVAKELDDAEKQGG